MAKIYSTQCGHKDCGVWVPITTSNVVGTYILCPLHKAMALHPAGKKLEKVS
jgi:nitrite reductase/ring-hydroxylating ferredoxin subunit